MILALLVFSTTAYFLFIEYLQYNVQKKRYFYNTTNIIDQTSILSNFLIILNEVFDRKIFKHDEYIFDEVTGERNISTSIYSFFIAYAVICLWYRAFYWMRVFERPAFFILLIKKTLVGILPFIVLIVIILLLFSNVLYVFNMARH